MSKGRGIGEKSVAFPIGRKRSRVCRTGCGSWYALLHERPGKRRRPGSAAHGRAVAAAVENASPITRRAGRSRAAREGEETYSESSEARQRRKARSRCFTVLGLVRLSIQEPLAFCAS